MKTKKNKVLFFVLILMLFNINTVKAIDCNQLGQNACNERSDCDWSEADQRCRVSISGTQNMDCNQLGQSACDGRPDCDWDKSDQRCRNYTGNNTNNATTNTRKKCITCGEVNTIPASIPTFSRNVINLVQVLVPIIIIIMGIVTFLKALVSGEDKALSQARTHFIRMILVGIAILLIVTIIKLVFSFAGKSDDVNSVMKCISCFTTDKNACNITVCPERKMGDDESNNGSQHHESSSGQSHGGSGGRH